MTKENTAYQSFCKNIGPWKCAFMGHPSGSKAKGTITQIFGHGRTLIFAIYDKNGVLRQLDIKQ